MRVFRFLAFAAVAMIMATQAASSMAGTISGVSEVVGGGDAVVDPIITFQANNDNATTVLGGNVALVGKIFNANEPIDIVFTVDDSQGVTEYLIAEGVSNNTGAPFTAFAFQLGFGTGDDFVRAGTIGLDFDYPTFDPGPSSARFMTAGLSSDQLTWTVGAIPNESADAFAFSIDVPDYDGASMPAEAQTGTGYQFTLRQFPGVPEPGTLAMVVLSALSMAIYTLRRRWG